MSFERQKAILCFLFSQAIGLKPYVLRGGMGPIDLWQGFVCAYIVHTYTCHHIQHNIGKQVCLFIIFPEGGPLLFLQKYVCILMIACVHICNPLVCTVCTHMFWMHLRRWLCLCFHFMNRNSNLKSLWKMMFKLLPLAVYPEMSASLKKSHFQINDIHFRNV